MGVALRNAMSPLGFVRLTALMEVTAGRPEIVIGLLDRPTDHGDGCVCVGVEDEGSGIRYSLGGTPACSSGPWPF